MSRERAAWLVVSLAGSSSGVIAGLPQHVTTTSILAISGSVAVAAGIVTWILPRHADPVS